MTCSSNFPGRLAESLVVEQWLGVGCLAEKKLGLEPTRTADRLDKGVQASAIIVSSKRDGSVFPLRKLCAEFALMPRQSQVFFLTIAANSRKAALKIVHNSACEGANVNGRRGN
jgi:hypothetical protein